MASYILAIALTLSLGSVSRATQEKANDSKTVMVTGCLQKGDEAGEYSITSEDGKRYGLRSKTVGLAKHLGHKVTVTGTQVREESEEKDKKESGKANTRISE